MFVTSPALAGTILHRRNNLVGGRACDIHDGAVAPNSSLYQPYMNPRNPQVYLRHDLPLVPTYVLSSGRLHKVLAIRLPQVSIPLNMFYSDFIE